PGAEQPEHRLGRVAGRRVRQVGRDPRRQFVPAHVPPPGESGARGVILARGPAAGGCCRSSPARPPDYLVCAPPRPADNEGRLAPPCPRAPAHDRDSATSPPPFATPARLGP